MISNMPLLAVDPRLGLNSSHFLNLSLYQSTVRTHPFIPTKQTTQSMKDLDSGKPGLRQKNKAAFSGPEIVSAQALGPLCCCLPKAVPFINRPFVPKQLPFQSSADLHEDKHFKVHDA
jgi:hypothetical protein